MADIPCSDPDYDLWLLLNKTQRAVFKAREKELGQYGITPEQCAVMYASWGSRGQMTISDIARLMFREHHTISGLVERMEKKKLVEKVRDPRRKNVFRVALTVKGEQILEDAARRESIHRILSPLSGEQRRQLESNLQALLDSTLKELEKYYTHPFYRPGAYNNNQA